MENETLKDIVVIYHGNCRDGFGAAFAAWKKFGDTASYIPCTDRTELPGDLAGKEVYIVDFGFDMETTTKLNEEAKSLMIIDHHQSAENVVNSFPGNIFDNNHSGAVLAWKHFHPGTEVPELLLQVEDHDLWKFAMPENREYNTAIGLYPMTFTAWDMMVDKLSDLNERIQFVAKGTLVARYEDKIVNDMLKYKERVRFEGHEIWVLNVERTYRSVLGNRLAGLNLQEEQTPIGIVYYRYGGAVHVSLRSHGSTDVAEIAQKYGGGGHKNAASFRVKDFADLPFEFITSE